MEITTPISTLIVDEETIIPLSLTNPLFEQQGSHSLPFSVPYNRHNLWALNLPYTPQKSTKSGQTISATLVAYPLNETGEITVQTVTVDDRIELSFTTREGMFYAWANKTRLRELPIPQFTKEEILLYSNKPYPTGRWAIFPVVIEKSREMAWQSNTNVGMGSDGIFRPADEFEYYSVLNQLNVMMPSYSESIYDWRNLSVNETVEYFSPFLYVQYLFELIFKSVGLYIKSNELGNVPEFNRLCVLNNACYQFGNYGLRSDALLPDITVMEFIDGILNKFNAVLTLNYKERAVQISIRDTIIIAPTDKRLAGSIQITDHSHKTIHITHDTLSDDFAKEITEDPEEFADRNDYIYPSHFYIHDPDRFKGYTLEKEDLSYSDVKNLMVVMFKSGQFAYYQKPEMKKKNDQMLYDIKMEPLGGLMEQYKPEGEKVVQFHSKASIHSIFDVKQWAYFFNNDSENPRYIHMRASMFCAAFRVGGDYLTSTKAPKDGDRRESFPFCLSIYRGEENVLYEPGAVPAPTRVSPFGSCFPFDRLGRFLPDSSSPGVYPDTLSLQVMGEHGLRENFFKVTEEFYKHSGLRADVVHFNPAQVINHNMDEKVTIDGTECFLTQVNVEVSLNGLWITGVQAITAKPLLD